MNQKDKVEIKRLAKEGKTTVHDIVRDVKQYDLAAFLEAADQALLPDGGGDGLSDDARIASLLERAKNDDSAFVRYWATVGLMLRAQRGGDVRGATALQVALNDEWRTTRVVAAVGLIALEGLPSQPVHVTKAWECLQSLIEQKDPDGAYACIDALNAVDWLEESKRKHLLPAVEGFDPKGSGLTKSAAHDVLAFNGWPIPELLKK